FTEEVRRKGTTEKEELGRFVTFIREFADTCHHGKEELILFAAMVEHGFPRDGGPIAVMLHEHEQGRGLVRILRDRVAQQQAWSDADRQELAEVASGFATLLRAHIHKEDAILYPMAGQRLSPEALERVSADCEAYEARKTGSGEHERLHRLADDLLARHAPLTRDELTPSHRHAGGCC
ncbi:MAG TPA: hemerythrin domain-containing protein, partial [Anaeromyxobacteraceae bacterium]